MEIQVKKGVIEIFILSILSKGDSYGYKLISDLNKYVTLSDSTLYPILRRLEKSGELGYYDSLVDGRNRRYYKITPNGISHIKEFIKDWEVINKILEILKEK
jgi:PadR family transcriptional regulator PadR